MEKTLIVLLGSYLHYVIVLSSLLFLALSSGKKRKQILLFALITLPLAFILSKIAGMLYFNPRPFVAGNFTPLIPHDPTNGFPSGHTLWSSGIAMVVYFFNKKLGAFFLLLALIVGLARIAAGIHSPLDVAGSFVISIATAFFVHRFIMPKLLRETA